MQIFQGSKVPIKASVDDVEFEGAARKQVENLAAMPATAIRFRLDLRKGFVGPAG